MSAHVPKEASPFADWKPVIAEICKRRRVAWREVVAGYRDRRVAACRHEIWATLYRDFRSSYDTIGARTGGYDHTTVRTAVLKFSRSQR